MDDVQELPTAEGEVEVRGEIVKTAKRDYGDWSWALLRVEHPKPGQIKIVGDFPRLRVGARVTAVGTQHEHPTFGAELRVRALLEDLPTKNGVVQWLLATLPGIGPVRARECVERWPDTLWEIIEQQPLALRILGLSEEQVQALQDAYWEARSSRAFYIEGIELGLSLSEIRVCWSLLRRRKIAPNERSWAPFRAQPLDLYYYARFSFARVEQLIELWRVQVPIEQRVAAGVSEVLRAAGRDGHTVMQLDHAFEAVALLFHELELELTDQELIRGVDVAIEIGRVADVDLYGTPGLSLSATAKQERIIVGSVVAFRLHEVQMQTAQEGDHDADAVS